MYTAHYSQQSLSQQKEPIKNCAFEIGVHDMELDPQLLDYFSKSRPDLYAYVTWNFLGLEQKTKLLRPIKAYFDLKVTYCGPPSVSVCNHITQTAVPLELMLQDKNGKEEKFGEGNIELLPALQQPGKRFFRCVPIKTTITGQAFLYCSFKQHNDCCSASVCPGGRNCKGCNHMNCPKRIKPVQLKECIEVNIGRLRLDNMDFPNSSRPPHIYIEYSILGYCGSNLETESEPKGELLQFKHKKRLSVTKNNDIHLKKMLRKNDPEPLKFTVLTEPCELSRDKDIEEIGSATINLREDMLNKGQDLFSAQLPVLDKNEEVKGTLSVTILGIDTLRNHAE